MHVSPNHKQKTVGEASNLGDNEGGCGQAMDYFQTIMFMKIKWYPTYLLHYVYYQKNILEQIFNALQPRTTISQDVQT